MKPIKLEIEFLKYLYPKYLVLLALLPLFLGYIIDFELVHPISILVNLVWMLLFTIPFYYFRKIFIYYLAVVFYFLFGFLEIGHWLILEGPLTITSLLNILNSNYNEVVSFVNFKFDMNLLFLIPYVFLFIGAIKHPPKTGSPRTGLVQLSLIILIPGIISFILLKSLPKTDLVPQFAKVFYATTIELQKYNKALADNKLRKVEAVLNATSLRQTFVLIIGESCSRNHMSLYGGFANTNPRLEKRADLIVFDDVVSPHTYTTLAIPNILSNANLDNDIEFAKSIDLLDVFHSAGFKTYWISNQSAIGIWDNVVSSIGSKADVSKFVNVSSNSSQEAILNKSYDSRLFEPFRMALEDDAASKFIVLHLMGSHNTYSKRYPPEFDQFNGGDSKEQLIAEYRNSVLYNDFVVDSLLNILQASSSNDNSLTSAIYTSDHGENLYDEDDKIGHDYANTIPRANVEIPFMLWVSNNYRDFYPSKYQTILRNRVKPFVTDDLFHSVLDINNIHVPYLENARSIFSIDYNDQRKRILADGNDYDNR
ncbi:MAG TPA: phosphoethanolamine transferase [Eudoraea sp.]|nr:phosphoethanolamine transferase [Eudoraea sp.]